MFDWNLVSIGFTMVAQVVTLKHKSVMWEIDSGWVEACMGKK